MKPVPSSQASPQVKISYDKIRDAIGLPHVPIFFTYLGAFPEYLEYITDQVVENLQSHSFKTLSHDIGVDIQSIIAATLPISDKMQEWKLLHKFSPEYFYFQKDTLRNYELNLQLAFIFIALREAVKGWAVAAKKLPETAGRQTNHFETATEEDLIFGNFIATATQPTEMRTANINSAQNAGIMLHENALAKGSNSGIVQNLLPQYIRLCQLSFMGLLKNEQTLFTRVRLEKIILSSIDLLPHFIVSPINVVYQLTAQYPEFYELIHLLSEKFPTLAMHRAMFSGYMNTSKPS